MRSWLLLVLVGGCALTVPDNVDRDNDLRPDTEDNCPDRPNPDQSDFDYDGVGDVCDVCDSGNMDDADLDGIPDGCDGCIGNGNDVDMDGIDDACDDDACTPVPNDTDMDGDGVLDSCDACDVGPQHDEDNDGWFDACDNCPSVYNPGQSNTADEIVTDMIGDACDAFPATVDQAVFASFTASDPSFYVGGVGITFDHDALRVRSPDLPAYVMSATSIVSPHVEARTRIVPASPAGSSSVEGILFADGLHQPALSSVFCYIDESGAAPRILLELTVNGVTVETSETRDPGAPPWNLTLNVNTLNGTVRCGNPADPLTLNVSSTTPTTSYYVGLYAQSPRVAFNYLWVTY